MRPGRAATTDKNTAAAAAAEISLSGDLTYFRQPRRQLEFGGSGIYLAHLHGWIRTT